MFFCALYITGSSFYCSSVYKAESVCRNCQSDYKITGRSFGFVIVFIGKDFVYEDTMDYFDSYIPDYGCGIVSSHWIKWWYTKNEEAV